jgi:hypothetical protein
VQPPAHVKSRLWLDPGDLRNTVVDCEPRPIVVALVAVIA